MTQADDDSTMPPQTSSIAAKQAAQLNAGVRKLLNSHGHAFHHKVMEHVINLDTQGTFRFPWRLHTVEFPVDVNGESTRVDFVLEQSSWGNYIVAECKRQAPQTCWVFYSYSESLSRKIRIPLNSILAERLEPNEGYPKICARPGSISMQGPICHGSMVLSCWPPSEGNNHKSRDSIDDAVTQVVRGVNGLIDHQARLPVRANATQTKTFVPVIITNASLHVTNVDLANTDMATGELPTGSVATKQEPWVFYYVPVSPMLKHSVDHLVQPDNLQTMLRSHFLRTVVILNAAEIENFLRTAMAHE